MRPIVKLSPEVVGKIAAGEVLERPAAAIKEMVENSMDAGASAITIEIRDGGIAYIRVTDNGSGIPQPQIRMAFERHATSKIVSSEDLHHIETLGFRGEALASIAAVSRVTCTTRVRGEDSGISVINEGGVIQDIREAACPEGTTFIIRDLFFNTPVRLKFLKKPAAEAAFVSDLVMRLILSNPAISFRLINQGKVIYHSPGDGKLESAVYSIYGKEMLKSMRYVSGGSRGVWMEGYVGIGDSARGTRSHQSFFINGRYMKSALLAQALEQGCRERVTIGHFPTCVLHLKMALEAVDVNVHPNKMEVRFQNENDIFEAVRDMIQEVLRKDAPLENVPEMELNPANAPRNLFSNSVVVQSTAPVKPDSSPNVPSTKSDVMGPASDRPEFKSEPRRLEPQSGSNIPVRNPIVVPVPGREQGPVLRETYMPASVMPALSVPLEEVIPSAVEPPAKSLQPVETVETISALPERERKPDLKVLGVVFQTYILIEYGDQLLLIDQHAAHERLLFDQMIRAYDQHAASQPLLVPQVVTLTHRELETLQENQEALSQAVF